MQPVLKFAHHFDPLSQAGRSPCRLSHSRPRNRSEHFSTALGFELTQNFACRRVHRRNLPRPDLYISSHTRRFRRDVLSYVLLPLSIETSNSHKSLCLRGPLSAFSETRF